MEVTEATVKAETVHVRFPEKVEKAIRFAAKAHDGQYHKSAQGVPYVSHAFTVGYVLAQHGFSDDVIVAGMLHDVVEDTDIRMDEIENQFGTRVAEFVAQVTDPGDLTAEQRLSHHLSYIRTAPEEVLAVKAVDILHNVYSKLVAVQIGDRHWEKTGDTLAATVNKYEVKLQTLQSVWQHAILDEIAHYLALLKTHV